jgi:hypothetical protein
VTVTALEPDTATPTRFRIEAVFAGFLADASVILAAAQATVALGVRCRDGETIVRVEAIHGDGHTGTLPERCMLVAEVTGSNNARVEAATAEVIDCLHDAANRPECTSDLDITVQRTPGPAR